MEETIGRSYTILIFLLVVCGMTLWYVRQQHYSGVVFLGKCPACAQEDAKDMAELFGPAESRRHKPKVEAT
jgi:hypothetical protein